MYILWFIIYIIIKAGIIKCVNRGDKEIINFLFHFTIEMHILFFNKITSKIWFEVFFKLPCTSIFTLNYILVLGVPNEFWYSFRNFGMFKLCKVKVYYKKCQLYCENKDVLSCKFVFMIAYNL